MMITKQKFALSYVFITSFFHVSQCQNVHTLTVITALTPFLHIWTCRANLGLFLDYLSLNLDVVSHCAASEVWGPLLVMELI